jgi:hypothetical protein
MDQKQMSSIFDCEAQDCLYNLESQCHAFAIP